MKCPQPIVRTDGDRQQTSSAVEVDNCAFLYLKLVGYDISGGDLQAWLAYQLIFRDQNIIGPVGRQVGHLI